MGIIYHGTECTCFGSKAILHVAYLLLNNLFSQLWAPYVVIYLERIALMPTIYANVCYPIDRIVKRCSLSQYHGVGIV